MREKGVVGGKGTVVLGGASTVMGAYVSLRDNETREIFVQFSIYIVFSRVLTLS